MISIICPIYNEVHYIDRFLQSILAQDYDRSEMEVILVDGKSTDTTREKIMRFSALYPFVRLVDNPSRIVSTAMNIGIRASRGDIIIRMDAHALFPTNYCSELARSLIALNADNVGGICSTLPAGKGRVCIGIANVLKSRFGVGDSLFRIGTKKISIVDTVPFGCFHRDLFERIGYFDEELIRNQDDEFNGRIIKHGGRIFLLPHLVIDYYARDSIDKVFKMFYQYGLFKPLVNRKLGNPATYRQFFPPLFVLGIVAGPLTFLLSPWLIGAYLIVLMLYVTLALFYSFRDSKDLQQVIVQVWVYFVVHFSYGLGYICGLFKLFTDRPFVVQSNH